jgi:hypothetical protein
VNELTFRNTAKARTLRTKIEQTLTVLSSRNMVSMSSSSPSVHHPGRRPRNLPKLCPAMCLYRWCNCSQRLLQTQSCDSSSATIRSGWVRFRLSLRQVRQMMRARYWQHGQPSKHCRPKAISAQKIWQPATAPGLPY